MSPDTQSPQTPNLRATLLLSCLAQFMVILDVSVVNVALPAIRHGLGFSEVDLQWVVNAYTVTFAGFLLLGGRAADLLGRRRVFVAGLTLFALASLAGGIADSQGVLIAARAVQGLGGAIIAPASLSILTTTFTEGAARNRAVGIWGAMGGAGGAAGVLLGGVITDLSVLALDPLHQRPDRAAGRGRGAAVHHWRAATPAAPGSSTCAAPWPPRSGSRCWCSASCAPTRPAGATPSTLILIVAGLALLGLFVVIEGWLARAPLMPLRIYRSRTLSAANIVILLVGASSFGMWFFVSLYLQQVLGYSPIRAGLAFLPMTLCIVAGSTLASRLVGRVGAKPILITGMASLAVGLFWFTDISPTGTYLGDMLFPSLLTAIGIGLAFVPATISAVAGVAPQEAGLASGLVNTARLFGGALGLAVLAAIATSRTNTELHHVGTTAHAALVSGFQLAFVVSAGFALVGGLVAAFGLPRLPARVQAPAMAPVESA